MSRKGFSDMACHHQSHPGKKLIVCCDGTWMNSDGGYVTTGMFQNPRVQVPSNVTRLCRAIKADACDAKVPQIVYYQAGVGTGLGLWDKVAGGGTGLGLSENIREAYSFLANNYERGDEIYLVGFSRGAFTARSIAGLINKIGLLTKDGLAYFYEIFKDYENEFNPSYRPQEPDIPYKGKASISDPSYSRELEAAQLTRLGITIKAIAVWDTVGSLGIPNVSWLKALGIRNPTWEYAFHDTKLASHIENAFQALAIDEHRGPFSPAVWEKPQGVGTLVRQCWFPGEHTNIGGGHEDTNIANMTLAWMMDQLNPFIEFNDNYLRDQWTLCQQSYKTKRQVPRPWGCGKISTSPNFPPSPPLIIDSPAGKIPNSASGVFAFADNINRTPGHYSQLHSASGRPTGTLMEQTNETIHASVRHRHGRPSLGTEDKGVYQPVALKDWTLVTAPTDPHQSPEEIRKEKAWWEYRGSAKGAKVIREEPLGVWELALLEQEPDVYASLMGRLPAPRTVTNGVGH
ncbi:MAG: hypothetical protein M1817_001055 [Caeruleum heppii]|nr:MAG: hypothetical protein M1817_001055 [Caeruleum heppii]